MRKIAESILLFVFMVAFFAVMIFGFTGNMGLPIPVVIFIEFFIGLVGWQLFKDLKVAKKSNITITSANNQITEEKQKKEESYYLVDGYFKTTLQERHTDYWKKQNDPFIIGSAAYMTYNSSDDEN